MYLKFGSLNIWPTREQINSIMPNSCKEKFPNTRTIIDCVEFKVEVPSKLFLHKLFGTDQTQLRDVQATSVGISFLPSITHFAQSFIKPKECE